jgi:hypothetical protein
MAVLDSYLFLQAALDDMALAAELTKRGLGTPRNIVTLLHDALGFVLYEALLAADEDIRRNGRNTIGLDAAIGLCETKGLDLRLLGTIRGIQKHRGDAKHHAQHPHEAAFAKIIAAFRVVASRVVHERFGQTLGEELGELGLLPYHLALHDSYRKYRTHNWTLALRFALAALHHKHRDVLASPDDCTGGAIRSPGRILSHLPKEVANAAYPPPPALAIEALTALPGQLAALLEAREYLERPKPPVMATRGLMLSCPAYSTYERPDA